MKTFKERLGNPDALELLRKAFCDEWLAYHQYWLGAGLVQAPQRVVRELEQHAAEELEHASWILEIFKKSGQRPPMDPDSWKSNANCAFTPPTDAREQSVLKQNLTGELCAIRVYEDIVKVAEGDVRDMVERILDQEREHANDLRKLIEKVKD
jgi:bacterioferritin